MALSYRGIADVLRSRILSGELAEGSLLPSEHELASEFGVSPATARTAIGVLVNEGMVTGERGRGRRVTRAVPLVAAASEMENVQTRVASGVDSWKEAVRARGQQDGMLITCSSIPAPEDVARWLEIKPGDYVAVRWRVRKINGAPDNLNDTYYPSGLTEQFPEILDPVDVPQGFISLMASRGVVQVRYVDELRWRAAFPDEITRLQIPAGVPVLQQARIGYTSERAVKCTVTVWPGHNHVLRYEMPA